MSLSIITTIGLKLRMLMFYIEFFCENCIISAVINMQIIFDNVIKKYISKFIQNRLYLAVIYHERSHCYSLKIRMTAMSHPPCKKIIAVITIIPPLVERGRYCNHLVRPSVHTFVTDISASTGRNDCTSTSCLPCDLQMSEWGYS